LLERLEAHGGAYRLADRASRIHVDRRGVCSVLIDGEASPTGAGFVVADCTGEQLAELSDGQGILKRAERDWPRISPSQARFVVSIVVRSEGLPDPLGREIVVVPKDDRDPPLHIVRLDPTAEIDATREARGESLLVVEALIPARAGEPLDGVGRERILEMLGRALPFFDRHLVVVDSPHDGRPLWHYESDGSAGSVKKIERIRLHGASASAEPMVTQWSVDGPSYLSLAGEPVRGPVGRAMLVGSSVLPALGQEGELLAAWSAVRVITRTDGQKERIRRSMWSKVELG
jgi:hypothetical protein